MKIIKFKYFSTNDDYDLQYDDGYCWSRIFEYNAVLDFLQKDLNIKNKKIHNGCWGYQGVHILFKNNLESICDNVINSDIKYSNLSNTIVHNIIEDKCEFDDTFDYVINISTLEEINADHVELIKKQIKHLKSKGFLIITFDLPGLQLENVENLCCKKIEVPDTLLTNFNSIIINKNFSTLNCGILIIQKK